MLSASPAWAVASATHRELRRRPGLLLSLLGAGCLLAFLQRLSATILGASGSLTTELSLATASLFLSLVAGVAGVRAAGAGDDLGPTPQLLSSPMSRGQYLLGRLGGITGWATLALLVLMSFAGAGHLLSGSTDALPVAGDALLACSGILLQVALFASFGMLVGALFPVPLATVLVLAFLVGSRLLIPELAAGEGVGRWIALAAPDPLRLDLAREVGFSRPISGASMALALAATSLQVAAMLLLATASLSRREAW